MILIDIITKILILKAWITWEFVHIQCNAYCTYNSINMGLNQCNSDSYYKGFLAFWHVEASLQMIPYSAIMWWGKILANWQPFSNVIPTNIFPILIYSIGAYFYSTSYLNESLYCQIVVILSFKISLSHLPAVDLVIASVRIIAITGQPLSCFHLPHVLIAKCGSLVYSEFKHTHYYILSSITDV